MALDAFLGNGEESKVKGDCDQAHSSCESSEKSCDPACDETGTQLQQTKEDDQDGETTSDRMQHQSVGEAVDQGGGQLSSIRDVTRDPKDASGISEAVPDGRPAALVANAEAQAAQLDDGGVAGASNVEEVDALVGGYRGGRDGQEDGCCEGQDGAW